jgi:hypothetical protein
MDFTCLGKVAAMGCLGEDETAYREEVRALAE